MRILFIFLFVCLAGALHSQETTIRFYYNDPEVDSLRLLDADRISISRSGRNADNSFFIKANVDTGYYLLLAGREYFYVYLQPGYALEIRSDFHSPDSTLSFSGKGSGENNYLAKKSLINIPSGLINHEDILKNADENTKKKKKLLDKSGIKNRYFVNLETNSIFYEDLVEKIGGLRFLLYTKQNNEAGIIADSMASKVNINQPEMAGIPAYVDLILLEVNNKTQKIMSGLTGSVNRNFGYTSLYLADSIINDQQLKDKVMYKMMIAMRMVMNSEEAYKLFTTKVKDERFLKEIGEKIERINFTKAGAVSPDFKYYDLKDDTVTLSSLRGKFVYIDIWATWCMPCKREIPYLETLQEEMKNENIAFVSICAMDKKDSWISFLNSRKMGGIQLFAPATDDFLKSYSVSSIPRFILIDPTGRIVDPNAKRPSDPELKAELENLLKKD